MSDLMISTGPSADANQLGGLFISAVMDLNLKCVVRQSVLASICLLFVLDNDPARFSLVLSLRLMRSQLRCVLSGLCLARRAKRPLGQRPDHPRETLTKGRVGSVPL